MDKYTRITRPVEIHEINYADLERFRGHSAIVVRNQKVVCESGRLYRRMNDIFIEYAVLPISKHIPWVAHGLPEADFMPMHPNDILIENGDILLIHRLTTWRGFELLDPNSESMELIVHKADSKIMQILEQDKYRGLELCIQCK